MLISSKRSSLLIVLFPLIITTIFAQTTMSPSSPCSEQFRALTLKKNLKNCKKLPTLDAEFGWNYHESIGHQNRTNLIEILFGVPRDKTLKWIAWGVNPGKEPQMVGTRALIGILGNDSKMTVETYNITAYTKLGCPLLPSPVEFPAKNIVGEASNGRDSLLIRGFMTIFARIELDERFYNASRLNHVWQVGLHADPIALEPMIHGSALQNFDSSETINLISGESKGWFGHHRRHLRMVHGILNIVGWGTLLPIGVIIARYFRKFPVESKKWFCLHVSCQIAGYIIGTAGWAIGYGLGRSSSYYTFKFHRLLAILIFTFTTLQMLALRLRPKSHDDYRKYWDMYHHFLGYALLATIGFNIFQGIAILKPNNYSWKWAYIGLLILMGLVTLGFEIFTWVKFLRLKSKSKKNDNNSIHMKTEIKNDIKENKNDIKENKNDSI